MALSFAVDDLLSVRIGFRVLTQTDRAFNVLHYRIRSLTGAPASLTLGLSEIAERMYDLWADDWEEAASENVAMQGVTVTSVFPLPRSVAHTYVPIALAEGAVVSDAIPLQDAPTILKKSDYGARWGMGRLFVVGTPESHQQAGILNATGISALAGLIERVKSPVTVSGTGWSCVVDPVLLKGPEDNPGPLNVIHDSRLSDEVVEAIERRAPGKGS